MDLSRDTIIRYSPYVLAILALACELARQLFFILDSTDVFLLFLTASILISISAIIIRLFVIDPSRFSSAITNTDIIPGKDLVPSRFLNVMPVAMVTCTVADVLMPVEFIVGMLVFTIAQLLYIYAYSGIIHLDPKSLFSEQNKLLTIFATIFWFLIASGIYFLLIFSPDDIITIAVIPYVIVLTIMVIVTTIAAGYRKRSFLFKLMLLGGGVFFLISDTILAINRFNPDIELPGMSIGLTYLMAVFLLQFAIMNLKSLGGKLVTKQGESAI